MKEALSLVGTGAALGVVHVLTGPDHLSAIATLSASVGSMTDAFVLGVRWGIGHSTGLVLVGIVLILISHDEDRVQVPAGLTVFFESLVGVFMIVLGAYGMHRAWEKRCKAYSAMPTNANDALVESPEEEGEPADEGAPTTNQAPEVVDATHSSEEFRHNNFDVQNVIESDTDGDDESSNPGPYCALSRWNWLASRVQARTMAVFAGIIHGLAGPGGVLGVIPAVELHSSKLAAIYLGTFCISSTLTMGAFSTLYMTCSSRLVAAGRHRSADAITSREFWIESLSASLSILVGVAWLILLSIGKLEDVFP